MFSNKKIFLGFTYLSLLKIRGIFQGHKMAEDQNHRIKQEPESTTNIIIDLVNSLF